MTIELYTKAITFIGGSLLLFGRLLYMLYIKLHDIPILDLIVLPSPLKYTSEEHLIQNRPALHLLLGSRSQLGNLIVLHGTGIEKVLLKVSVDHSGCLRVFGALPYGPAPDLILADREEVDEVQKFIALFYDLVDHTIWVLLSIRLDDFILYHLLIIS